MVSIQDSNDVPTNVSLSNNTVDENSGTGTFIATLSTDDIDAAQTFSYGLVSGTGSNNNASFRISNDSLYSNAVFNYETKPSYTIRIRTTDNGSLSFEKQFDILVSNTNDNPTDISLSGHEITENKPSRTYIGSLTTADQDVANAFTYALVSGAGSTDNAAFVITAGDLYSNRVFNYEQQKTFSIRVQTNDGNGGSYEKAFTILITDTNDGFLYSFANVQGNNNSNFFIIGNELRTNATFDFETKNFYIIVLNTTDASGASYIKQFVINIKDSVDAPVALDLSNNSIAENEAADAYIGTLSATDADQFSGFTYTLVPGSGATNNISFKISNDSLLAATGFNFEIKKTYSVRIRVTDATNATYEKAIVINILDANDAPTQLTLSDNNLMENKAPLTEIGTLTTADVDAGDAHSYSLVTGAGSADNASFIIEGNTLRSNFSANFEVKNAYSVRIATEDNGGSTFESVFVINIKDVSEKPTITAQTFSISENKSVGTSVGTVASTSPDAGADLVYSILGNNEFFVIDAASGIISNKVVLDYEKGRKYEMMVVVKDDQILPQFDTAVITIDILDEIEIKQDLPVNNYISPNNDGVNDYFEVENVELYADYSLTVFNEAGMQVYFLSANYQNKWDGTYEGKALPTGVYFFVFKNSKTNAEFKGALNITK